MALKVKAVERLLKFDKESAGEYRYVMKPEMYSTLSQAKVIREAALRSGVSQGVNIRYMPLLPLASFMKCVSKIRISERNTK